MLAKRFPSILPPLTFDEALETTKIHSIAGILPKNKAIITERPFRSPHHTVSDAALVGGGSFPKPGEVSYAHFGVLFLDELPEFSRHVLEVLREPLESGSIIISRATRQACFPARFQLVAAMNPCPCGYAGDTSGRCHCSADSVRRYKAQISGPLLDRIDLHVEVPRVPLADLRQNATSNESSLQVCKRVVAARDRQAQRAGKANAALNSPEVERDCVLHSADQQLLERAIDRLGLSARAYHRILRVARTIADLEASSRIASAHLSEAISYRRLERQ